MAKVVLIGLEPSAASQVRDAFADDHVIALHPHAVAAEKLLDADIVFAGGEPGAYLELLRRLRQARPTLPFVVITRLPETTEWLDALEAGATDYCSVPVGARQLQWMMQSAVPGARTAATA